MRTHALALLGLLASCTHHGTPIDRTGFDLEVCAAGPAGDSSPFNALTLTPAVDYLELREGSSRVDWIGVRCASAVNEAACESELESLTAMGWPSRTSGGFPAPLDFMVYVRGSTLAAVGFEELAAFLSPIDNPANAAFLAQAVTVGVVDCTQGAARVVAGGYEVLTTTSQTCGGGQTEQRVFVATDGSWTVRETQILSESADVVCP